VRVLVVAVILAFAVTARAESTHTIVFVGNDPELVDALETVMEPTSTGVKSIGDRLTPSLAELGPESRRLADEHHATATVWLTPTTNGATLITYERSADSFIVREVPFKLPLETTQAFETARMVRVMLRAIAERNDVQPTPVPVKPIVVTEPRGPIATASIGGGAWFATPHASAAPMTTLALAWRPYELGVAATAMLATTSDVSNGTYTGDVHVWRATVEGRYAIRVAPIVHVTPGLGLSLHSVDVALDGTDMVTLHRYNPGVVLSTTIGISLPHRVEAALALSADCLLRRQRYAAGNDEVLAVPRVQAMVAILIGIRL